MKSRRSGFTLIELLIVVAIIGIIVAISVVNYLSAIQRARQKRSMADMRTVGMAIDAYSIDYTDFPPAAANTLPGGLAIPTKTITGAAGYIEPTYMQRCPVVDGWNSWFLYTSDGKHFAILSSGANGAAEASPTLGPTTQFDADIIFADGEFLQWPEGVQQN